MELYPSLLFHTSSSSQRAHASDFEACLIVVRRPRRQIALFSVTPRRDPLVACSCVLRRVASVI